MSEVSKNGEEGREEGEGSGGSVQGNEAVLCIIMILERYKQVLSYSIKPPNIIFPIPLIPSIVGLAAGSPVSIWKPLLLTFVSYPAINLWNHINDAIDDYNSGKDTPFIRDRLRSLAVRLSAFLYFFSGIISYLLGGIVCLTFYIIVAVFTFLYSDMLLTGLRLKSHYLTELLTYVVTIPSFILMLYSSVSSLDLMAFKLTILFTPLLIATVFVKDLKDISADKAAGLKTLGVVFSSKSLIKSYTFSILIFYIISFILFVNTYYLVVTTPIIGLFVGFYGFLKNNWYISKKTIKYYMYIFYSTLFSVLILFGMLLLLKVGFNIDI